LKKKITINLEILVEFILETNNLNFFFKKWKIFTSPSSPNPSKETNGQSPKLKAISKMRKSTNIQLCPTIQLLSQILLFSPFFSKYIFGKEGWGEAGSCLFLYQKEKENKLVWAKSF
jgi:hypothetical protein